MLINENLAERKRASEGGCTGHGEEKAKGEEEGE